MCVKSVLIEMGYPQHHPYSVKKAALTFLYKSGIKLSNLAAQARNSPDGSTTLKHYILSDGGLECSQQLVNSFSLHSSASQDI
jgi:hypothetical protein